MSDAVDDAILESFADTTIVDPEVSTTKKSKKKKNKAVVVVVDAESDSEPEATTTTTKKKKKEEKKEEPHCEKDCTHCEAWLPTYKNSGSLNDQAVEVVYADKSIACGRQIDELEVKSVTDIRAFNKNEKHSWFELHFALNAKQKISAGSLTSVAEFPLQAKSFHDTQAYSWPFPRTNEISPFYERRPVQEAYLTFETDSTITHSLLSKDRNGVGLQLTSLASAVDSVVHSVEIASESSNVPVSLARSIAGIENLQAGHPAYFVEDRQASSSSSVLLFDIGRSKDSHNQPIYPCIADQEYGIWGQFQFAAFKKHLVTLQCDYDAEEDEVTTRGTSVESAGKEVSARAVANADQYDQSATGGLERPTQEYEEASSRLAFYMIPVENTATPANTPLALWVAIQYAKQLRGYSERAYRRLNVVHLLHQWEKEGNEIGMAVTPYIDEMGITNPLFFRHFLAQVKDTGVQEKVHKLFCGGKIDNWSQDANFPTLQTNWLNIHDSPTVQMLRKKMNGIHQTVDEQNNPRYMWWIPVFAMDQLLLLKQSRFQTITVGDLSVGVQCANDIQRKKYSEFIAIPENVPQGYNLGGPVTVKTTLRVRYENPTDAALERATA